MNTIGITVTKETLKAARKLAFHIGFGFAMGKWAAEVVQGIPAAFATVYAKKKGLTDDKKEDESEEE